MDSTQRRITKIAREVSKFTVQTMKEEGIGTAEFDVIHLVRHNPGITQKKVCETLKIDKGAAAKRVASLEHKAHIETVFYEWLLEDLSEAEKETFCATLDKLYWKSKEERRTGFTKIAKRLAEEEGEKDA